MEKQPQNLKGTIIDILPEKNGVSQQTGKEWTSQQFVLTTAEEYPQTIIFDLFGKKEVADQIKLGDVLNVHFSFEAKAFNSKYYQKIKAWRIEFMQPEIPTRVPVQAVANPADQYQYPGNVQTKPDLPITGNGFTDDNDLPF